MLGINEPPKRAMAMGGILRWKDGRNMPDVHASLFEYGDIPVYMRLNLGTRDARVVRFQGSKGIIEVTEFSADLHSAARRSILLPATTPPMLIPEPCGRNT